MNTLISTLLTNCYAIYLYTTSIFLYILCYLLYSYLFIHFIYTLSSTLFLPFIHFISTFYPLHSFFNLFIHIIYTLLCTVFVLYYALYLCLLSTLFISRELPSLYLVITFFTVTLFAVPIPYHPLYVSIYFILSLLSTLFIPCQLHLKKKIKNFIHLYPLYPYLISPCRAEQWRFFLLCCYFCTDLNPSHITLVRTGTTA